MAAEKKPVSDEKIRQYAEARKQKDTANRQKRRRELAEGLTGSRRLTFLTEILSAYGISRTELAKRLNNTTQNIYWIFSVKDDCTIGKAKEILAAIGLKLDIEIVPSTTKKKTAPKIELETEFTTEDRVQNKIVTKLPELAIARKQPNVPKYIRDYPDNGNLGFLKRYIKSSGYAISELERMIGMSRSSIRQFFIRKNDDIDISKIYDIARVTGGQINWIVEKLDTE